MPLEMIKLYLKDNLDQMTNMDAILPSIFLTPGIPYNTTVIYDPKTLQPSDPFYIITCDDGKKRKVSSKWFISQSDWRELKLNELGI